MESAGARNGAGPLLPAAPSSNPSNQGAPAVADLELGSLLPALGLVALLATLSIVLARRVLSEPGSES